VTWKVAFYSTSLADELLALPPGLLAKFLRYTERLEPYGPRLGPTTHAGDHGVTKTLKAFSARALSNPRVRQEYDRLDGEFAYLDER